MFDEVAVILSLGDNGANRLINCRLPYSHVSQLRQSHGGFFDGGDGGQWGRKTMTMPLTRSCFVIGWNDMVVDTLFALVKPVKHRVVSDEAVAGTEIPGGWGRGRLYLSLHWHHQNDSCIKMGSDESHFNLSFIVRDKVTRQCPQTTTFEEKGEPKRNRIDVPLLASLKPYR